MGEIFYDMGFLASSEVCECSASDLVGQYLGHTGPKTTAQLEKALGRVLFIDEAYRLGEGQFATEAINELVDNLTKTKFANKLIVILAGYTNAMNQLLQVNQGLASRFPEEVIFENMRPEHCLKLLRTSLEKSKVDLQHTANDKDARSDIIDTFENLAKLRSWGNGRDVNTISRDIVAQVYRDAQASDSKFSITEREVAKFLENVLKQKSARERNPRVRSLPSRPKIATSSDQNSAPPLPPQNTSTSSAGKAPSTQTEAPQEDPVKQKQDAKERTGSDESDEDSTEIRDAGVSDEIWNQLQADKAATDREEQRLIQTQAETQKKFKEAQKHEADLQKQEDEATAQERHAREQRVQGANNKIGCAQTEILRKKQEEAQAALEKARIAHAEALRKKQEAEEQRRKAAEAVQEMHKKEQKAQQKLREMGVCPMGFRWIKQAGGYRCAGGSHFVENRQLSLS